ncbi:hypothetical protein [Lysinibacillus sp. NPDC056232]|uniref:hypothetical protein n=1 Tax=Lysinibacillus sp. NPDC056232 TaxID=3345756 RepID=UPI0035DF4C10
MEWRLGDYLGISERGTKAKNITFCDNACVSNKAPSRNGNQPHVMVYGDKPKMCVVLK